MSKNDVLVVLRMLKDGQIELVTMCGQDVLYNPNMNGGEFELFDQDGDHIQYLAYTDIYECSDALVRASRR